LRVIVRIDNEFEEVDRPLLLSQDRLELHGVCERTTRLVKEDLQWPHSLWSRSPNVQCPLP
jgi:hypothetical protein